MKVLYAVQGTGNGHISRAEVLIPIFKEFATVDILLSGTSANLKLNFPVKYQFKGLSFVFGTKGGVNILKTLLNIDLWQFIKDVKKLDLNSYDLVINDFEPVSAWAGFLKKKNTIALSHQYSLLDPNVPKSNDKAFLAKLILKYYAPTKTGYGFHFKQYTETIYHPIIKNEFINQKPVEKNHYLVYLPAYSDQIICAILEHINFTNWVVFSKHTNTAYSKGNIDVFPLSTRKFNEKLLSAKGVICGAGFETPAEALYLQKKLMVVPMKNQYEQQCNAEALKEMGIPVLYSFDKSKIQAIESWVTKGKCLKVNYSNNPTELVSEILLKFKRPQNIRMKAQVIALNSVVN